MRISRSDMVIQIDMKFYTMICNTTHAIRSSIRSMLHRRCKVPALDRYCSRNLDMTKQHLDAAAWSLDFNQFRASKKCEHIRGEQITQLSSHTACESSGPMHH